MLFLLAELANSSVLWFVPCPCQYYYEDFPNIVNTHLLLDSPLLLSNLCLLLLEDLQELETIQSKYKTIEVNG